MRKFQLFICGLFLSGLVAASDTTSPLADFFGEWEGPGTMFGGEATVSLSWMHALDNRFAKLHIHYQSRDDDQPFEFEGIAYYRTDNDASFSGTWFDSQGNIHPLTSALQEGTLTTSWGTEATELGKSVYRLLDDGRLEVIDSVKGNSGEFLEFGRAVLSRRQAH